MDSMPDSTVPSGSPNPPSAGPLLTPLPEGQSFGVGVLLFGLATSVITLALVSALSLFTEVHVMGWYANFVIPVGAILVGLVSGCGYGIGSWLTGTRVHRNLLWAIVGLQLVGYFAIQYAEYWMFVRPQAPIGFASYFDMETRNFAWKGKGARDQPGQPLGAWGYGVRLLEIIGFAGGGLAAPAALMKKPYCDRCQVYKRTRQLGLVPAGVLPKKISKKDTAAQEAYQQELDAALAHGQKAVELLAACANQGDAESFVRLLTECCGKKKEVEKLTTRLRVAVDRCPRCYSGSLVVTAQSGFGEHMTSQEIARGELPASLLQAIDAQLRT